MKRAGSSYAKRLVEIRSSQSTVGLASGHRAPVAPIVSEESTDRPGAHHIERFSIAQRCCHVDEAILLSQPTGEIERTIPRLIRNGDDVAESGGDTVRKGESRRINRSV